MNATAEQIRDQQRESWNQFSPGWKKWDQFMMAFLRPMGDGIMDALQLTAGQTVLDVATGTGEPGLTIAANFPTSQIVGTDLAEGMLATAEARAQARRLTNYRTMRADVSALPFPDATFDAISCRMGFMFFPDMSHAAKEIVRVLKPGGRFSTSVWTAGDKNPWVTTMMGAIQRHIALPAPVPGAPGMFRCAGPALMANLFRGAGLHEVTEKDVSGKLLFDSADHYWEMMMDVAAPVVAAMSKADEPTRNRIKTDVYGILERFNLVVTLDYEARIISGTKA